MFARSILLGCLWMIFCSSLSVGLLSPGEEESPGIVIRLKPSALNAASVLAAKYLLFNHFRNSLSSTNNTANCNFNSCFLHIVTVKNYVSPNSNVTFTSEKRIEWRLYEAELDVDVSFEFTKIVNDGRGHVKGNASVHVRVLSFAAEFSLYRQSDGRLGMSPFNCAVDVSVVVINIIANWETTSRDQKFKNLFKTEVFNYIQDRVNDSLSTSLCNLAIVVARISYHPKWMNKELASRFGFFFDDTLTRDIIVNPSYIELAYRGQFRMVGDEVRASVKQSKFELPSTDSSMVAIYISEVFVNTLCDVLFQKGWLSVNITKDVLPHNYRSLYDTTCPDTVCFGTHFPKIAEMYPNRSVRFVVAAAGPPSAAFYAGFQRDQLDFHLTIVVPNLDGSDTVVAKLCISLTATKTISMHRDRVQGVVSIPSITATDIGSPKEFVQYLPRFNFALRMMADFTLVPLVNSLGFIDLPLILQFGIRLVNTDMSIIPHAFRFGTDIDFDPTPLITGNFMAYIYEAYAPLLRRKAV